MKKAGIGAWLVLAAAITACKKDVSGSSAGEVLGKGTWTVSYFWDKDHDETGHFSGYGFVFAAGSITATNGSSTVSGTYADGTDDSTPKLILHFTPTPPFDELNDDWHVTEKTSNLIKLEDPSGSGGTEILHFSRK